jgi:hypothetical protein
MENSGNFERAQASRARLAAPQTNAPAAYAGSHVKDALRAIGVINLIAGVGLGIYQLFQANSTQAEAYSFDGTGLAGGAILSCALLFGLAAIIENLIAIRQNTEG